jgi:rod shape-determining protein MreD
MKVVWTMLAVLAAVLLQSGLGVVAPGYGRVIDPFLLAVVYCGLVGGEAHGMLAGLLAGWTQDVEFGGSILGFSALAKMLIGFAVGAAGSKLLITGVGARTLVILVASFADAALVQWLAAVFAVEVTPIGALMTVWRATVSAAIGVLVFELIDRRFRRDLL